MDNQAPDGFFDTPDVSDGGVTDSTQLRALVDELVTLDGEIAAQKLALADLNSRHAELRSKAIPERLRELGTEVWQDDVTGYGVALELAVNAQLPQDPEKKQGILDALLPLGVREIINDSLLFQFTPGDDRIIELLLFAETNNLPGNRSTSVHPGRFKAWLKEQIESGHGVEVAEAGIWHGRHAKLVKPKAPKPKKEKQ